jgi:hypothetical protein
MQTCIISFKFKKKKKKKDFGAGVAVNVGVLTMVDSSTINGMAVGWFLVCFLFLFP